VNAVDMLATAVDKGVAYVPGAPFFADSPDERSLRLSFVTASEDQINTGMAALAVAVREYQAPLRPSACIGQEKT
jgi:2-aminoadipate transaminase